jgi:hypothetical protein
MPTSTWAASAMFCVIERLPAHVIPTDMTSPTNSAVRITTSAVPIGLTVRWATGVARDHRRGCHKDHEPVHRIGWDKSDRHRAGCPESISRTIFTTA